MCAFCYNVNFYTVVKIIFAVKIQVILYLKTKCNEKIFFIVAQAL